MFARLLERLLERRTRIDDARSLYRVDRDGYEYREGGRRLLVQVETLQGIPDRMIYGASIGHWLPPHDGEPLSEEKRREIAETIRDFLDRLGYHAAVKWS